MGKFGSIRVNDLIGQPYGYSYERTDIDGRVVPIPLESYQHHGDVLLL
jgi:hypothetical protein